MPSVAEVLKKEITRLARKEVRAQLEDVKRQSVAHRKAIAELRRKVASLEKTAGLLETKVLAPAPRVSESKLEGVRYSAKGITSQRKRLGLTAEEYGKLVGVSGQTIYNWERGASRPRTKQLAAIAAVRGIGKKETRARLELAGQRASEKV